LTSKLPSITFTMFTMQWRQRSMELLCRFTKPPETRQISHLRIEKTFDGCWIPVSFAKWRKEQTKFLQVRSLTTGTCLALVCQFSAAFSCIYLVFCRAKLKDFSRDNVTKCHCCQIRTTEHQQIFETRDQFCENTPGWWTCAVGHHEGLEPSQHRHSITELTQKLNERRDSRVKLKAVFDLFFLQILKCFMFLAFRYLDLARRQLVFCRQFSQIFGQGKDREGNLQSKSTRQRAWKTAARF
jgi:hypothetical protein